MTEGCREEGLFDFGMEEFGVAGADSVGEIGEVVEVFGVVEFGFGSFATAYGDFEATVGFEVEVAFGTEEIPAHGFVGVEAAKLADDAGAVGKSPGDVLGVGCLALILIAEAATGGADGNREPLAHAPTENVDHVDAIVAEFAVAEIPEPVPVVVDQIFVEGLHRGRADPEIPIEVCRWLLDGLEADGIATTGEEEVALIDVADCAAVDDFDGFAEAAPPAALGAAGGDAVISAGGFDELGAFENVVRYRLLDVDVFASLHGPDGGEGMPMVGGRDGDSVDGFVIEDAAHVGLDAGSLSGALEDGLGGSFSAGTIDFDEGGDFDVGDREQLFDVSGSAGADADDCDAEAVIRLRPGLGGSGGSDEEVTAIEGRHG